MARTPAKLRGRPAGLCERAPPWRVKGRVLSRTILVRFAACFMDDIIIASVANPRTCAFEVILLKYKHAVSIYENFIKRIIDNRRNMRFEHGILLGSARAAPKQNSICLPSMLRKCSSAVASIPFIVSICGSSQFLGRPLSRGGMTSVTNCLTARRVFGAPSISSPTLSLGSTNLSGSRRAGTYLKVARYSIAPRS